MERILDRMKKSPLVFDGAMGTMVSEGGCFINTCFDELSLSNPKLISQIHREYVEAGAEVIETNTFGANRIALRPYGLSEKVVEINRQAVRIAREAAGDSVYVAGAVGPCIRPDQIMPDEHAVEVEEAFAEQIGALVAEGIDLVILETFTHLKELRLAARAAKRLGAPVGPAVAGRLLSLTNPEYFAEYAKKYIELGVRCVGGCCGTTPAHIRVASRAIKSLSGVKKHVEVRPLTQQGVLVQVIPSERKSRLARKMLGGGKVTSVEIVPPRSSDLSGMLAKVKQCAEAGVDAINIPDGPRASARLPPMIAAITILKEVGIEPILHYCCRDRNLIGMQSDLLGGYAAGLANFLILTGDRPVLPQDRRGRRVRHHPAGLRRGGPLPLPGPRGGNRTAHPRHRGSVAAGQLQERRVHEQRGPRGGRSPGDPRSHGPLPDQGREPPGRDRHREEDHRAGLSPRERGPGKRPVGQRGDRPRRSGAGTVKIFPLRLTSVPPVPTNVLWRAGEKS